MIFRNRMMNDEWSDFLLRLSHMSRDRRMDLARKALALNYVSGEGRKKGYIVDSEGQPQVKFRYINGDETRHYI